MFLLFISAHWQEILDLLLVGTIPVTIASIFVRYAPLPGHAEDQIHARWYLIAYNTMRRIAINGPFKVVREETSQKAQGAST